MSQEVVIGANVQNWTLASSDKVVFDNPRESGEWLRADKQLLSDLADMC